MEVKTIPLTCPNCGNSDTTFSSSMHYGYEFKCKYCGSTSVLVINHRLYMPIPGEKVCVSCGRVADRNARFCQCRAPLTRKCINQKCLKEFPVDHAICDYCGWPQNVDPSVDEGTLLILEQALKDIDDPDFEVALDGIKQISLLLSNNPSGILISKHVDIQQKIQEKIQSCPSKKINRLIYSLLDQNHNLLDENEKLITNQAVRAIINLGYSIIPELVSYMERHQSYEQLKILHDILVEIGNPGVEVMQFIREEQELSSTVDSWLSSAIYTIERDDK